LVNTSQFNCNSVKSEPFRSLSRATLQFANIRKLVRIRKIIKRS
jgi:hypothetical protein